jgi:hypothetical protein
MLKTDDGKLVIFSGSSRCGKTTKVSREVRAGKFPAAFFWDVEAQFCQMQGVTRVKTISELIAIVKAGKRGKFAFVPAKTDLKAQFEKVCACVMHYGTYYGRCCFVAEELADVTTVSKAPDSWGMLVRRGLKRSISIYAISQRWQEADKTALGNATDFFIFMQSTKMDAKYMADKTDIDIERIWHLNKLEFLHYQKEGRILKGGKLTFQ